MFDLRALYQEVIIDHNRHPRNCRRLDSADRIAEGYNPLCGDRLTVYVKLHEGVVEDVSFEGSGCAISVASASLMTEHIKGKTAHAVDQLFARFHSMVTDATPTEEALGKLEVLAGVREFPARVKCATLAWHTLKSALSNEQSTVTTE
ncbi:MAG: Fe-S cluster assembly sulfur transfer protein SufU [Gammaproteobacteria bacterium]